MEYKQIEPQDIEIISKHLSNAHRICDFTIGTLFGWRSFYDFRYCIEDGRMYVKSLRDNCYLPPFDQDVDKFIQHIGGKGLISPVPQDMLPLFDKVGKAEKLENWSDYLYNAQDIITLAGKKYHSKRNFITRFESTYDWSFRRVEKHDLLNVEKFIKSIEIGDSGETASYEHKATISTLAYMDKLNLFGAVLVAEGEIVGFSSGEICGDTLFVHTERANREYIGSYEKLVNAFAKEFGAGCKYINREEDLGIEGMRKSKQSYQPVALLDKYTITIE